MGARGKRRRRKFVSEKMGSSTCGGFPFCSGSGFVSSSSFGSSSPRLHKPIADNVAHSVRASKPPHQIPAEAMQEGDQLPEPMLHPNHLSDGRY